MDPGSPVFALDPPWIPSGSPLDPQCIADDMVHRCSTKVCRAMAVRIANKTMTNDNRKQDDADEDDATCADDNDGRK